MKTKTIIASSLVAVIIAGTAATYAANTQTVTSNDSTKVQKVEKKHFGKFSKGKHIFNNLTEEEQTKLETMSDEEKKAFFEAKREEHKAQRDARENVIDKLLAGETLTAEEEKLRTDIIKERAERKAKMQEMEAKREQIKAIRDKQDAGEVLTDAEQETLDEMKEMRKSGKRGKRGGKID